MGKKYIYSGGRGTLFFYYMAGRTERGDPPSPLSHAEKLSRYAPQIIQKEKTCIGHAHHTKTRGRAGLFDKRQNVLGQGADRFINFSTMQYEHRQYIYQIICPMPRIRIF